MPFQRVPKICPVCQERDKFKFIQDHQNKDGRFSLYECNLCKVQFWEPFKNPNSQRFDKGYHTFGNFIKPKIYRACHKKFLQLSKNFSKDMKILDLGCGTGELLAEFQKRGFEVWGVDFSKNAVEIAKKYFALENIYLMSFNKFFKKNDLPQFDIITFFDVIEYLDDPLESIQNVKRLLKPGGRIVLSTPSTEKMLVNLNIWDFPPGHLTRWNKEAISNLFQKINFEISYIEYVKQFPLSKLITTRFRLGLVSKTENIFRKYHKLSIFIKVIHFLAYLKDYIISTILVGLLWIIDKMIKCNLDGEMLIELILRQPKNQ